MSSGFYAGVVKKKYTLFCTGPDGSSVELTHCYEANGAEVARQAADKMLQLMQESFDLDSPFSVKVVESMESAEDVPVVEIKKT